MTTDKPVYTASIDEWKGRKFDLGLFWIGPVTLSDGREMNDVVCHPMMIDPVSMGDGERLEFICYVRERLMEKAKAAANG